MLVHDRTFVATELRANLTTGRILAACKSIVNVRAALLTYPCKGSLLTAHLRLDLMADGPQPAVSRRLIEAVWLPFIEYAGCPGGQSRKNVPARGGVCVLIHQVNAN